MNTDRRLHYPREYRRFFDRSTVFRFTECTVFRIPNDLGHFRLGITLKARGTSVERNRAKRQIREVFRAHAQHLGSFDYNVVVPGTKKLAFPFHRKLGACLRKEIQSVFAR
ncbi:MAG TPA: ribonuclease P protein component [Bdellovibrionota bacterium]|nr:ribonuclease P protein component [Bdellovibrionota bacterium]